MAQELPPPASASAAGVDQALTTTVDLFFEGRSLRNLDFASKSDPYLIVEQQEPGGGWRQLLRTDTIDNDLNPHFPNPLRIAYCFEELQTLRLTMMDHDSNSADDLIGAAETTLAEIVSAPGSQLALPLHAGSLTSGCGFVIVTFEQANAPPPLPPTATDEEIRARPVADLEAMDPLSLAFSCRHLDKKDLLGKSDPYIVIERVLESGQRVQCWKSETIMKTLNPDWPLVDVSLPSLCNSDLDRPLRVSVWDWDRLSADDLIGEAETSVRELLTGAEIALIHPGKQAKKASYTNSGVLMVREFHPQPEELDARREGVVERRLREAAAERAKLALRELKRNAPRLLLDHLRGGLELSLSVAIDYTGSNGSLHNVHPGQPNEYERAIRQVGDVLAPYDTDGRIPVYGFGGERKDIRQTSHCFPVNFNDEDPEVQGVQGVLDVYAAQRPHISLSAPTNFAEILQAAITRAQAMQAHEYLVMLILTDGVISDMRETVRNIVVASRLPLSVVIVGVGGANFRRMDDLDSDERMLTDDSGAAAERDIVQFVPFREHCERPADLARVTLAELPFQVVDYMQRRGIEPGEARAADLSVLGGVAPPAAPAV